ncbi:Response regulator PleD [Tepidimonas taiwanensis]|uniref:diguanylate cyclase n=2 Tax=Tepidimonas taiwanensis TaxID=307486 RepID=A0A554XA48_9BURK|nr:Response regulator PleD [Tepidimonas taiwanensis]
MTMRVADLRLDHARALLRRSGVDVPVAGDVPTAQELQAIIDALCELSERDALTGLPNRRAFLGRLAQELDRSSRAGETALLLMLDIDHFKSVNDRHGHLAGDAVLRAVARTLQEQVRPMDTVARLGGEEYGIVLPNCGPGAGVMLAERLRQAVAQQAIALPDGRSALHVTVSIGGAYSPAWVRSTVEHWLERADRQLYEAKRQGRNRVMIEAVPVSDVSAEEKQALFAWSDPDGLIIDPADAV